MKVSKLIEQLQTHPQDAEVILVDWHGPDEQSIAEKTYFDKDREVYSWQKRGMIKIDCVVIAGV